MSGAKNCPETPRQKMIGMMYLVLTAMLALNVSSDILNGFTLVDNSLHTTIESSQQRNTSLYEDFDALNSQNPDKVGPWLNKAREIQKKSDDLFNYIENFKVDIVKLADKDKADPQARKIEGRDNLDVAGQYALVGKNGEKLKQKINEYRDLVVKEFEGNIKKQQTYFTLFSTADVVDSKNEKIPWEASMFEMMPVSAVVTILTKYQSDIRATETELVQYMKGQTDASDFRVNKIEALVVPNSKFVFRGEKYSARIVLSAVDSTKRPEYYINGSKLATEKYELTAGGRMGLNKYSGEIRLPGNDGTINRYTFESEYMVGEPSATISNVDLNVVYRGIDNNFSISVPGIAPENLSIAVSGGTYKSNGNGRFVINPNQDGEMKISVFGKIDNKQMAMGSGSFRVKRLPRPTAYLLDGAGNQTMGGLLSVNELKSTSVIASYGRDELVKANFRVVSFTMIVDGLPPMNVTGGKLDAGFLNKLTKGRNLILSNIVAVGPDGAQQSLGAILVKLA